MTVFLTFHAFFEHVADHFVHSSHPSVYGVHWVSISFERSKGPRDAGQYHTDQQMATKDSLKAFILKPVK